MKLSSEVKKNKQNKDLFEQMEKWHDTFSAESNARRTCHEHQKVNALVTCDDRQQHKAELNGGRETCSQ